MFWVITAATLPRRTSSATARWPRFGRASRKVSSIAKRRRQVSRRASSEARKSEKSIGAIRVQIPPGLRKSGIPDSVLMPAPVNTTARRAKSALRFGTVGVRTAYLAAEGYVDELREELGTLELRHGRLLIAANA